MKRIVALFLVLTCIAVLIPAGVQVDAANVTKKPFYTVNCLPVFWEDGDLVLDVPYFASGYAENHPNTTVSWRGISDIEVLAEELKAEFDDRPEGTRHFFYRLPGELLHGMMAENYVYFDKPGQIVEDWLDEFLAEYKRIGGKLDGIYTDVEYWHGAAYELWADRYKVENNKCYWDIVNNPKYTTVLRPKLEKYGFSFYPENMQDDTKSELWSMTPEMGYTMDYHIWNIVIDELLTEYLNASVLDPMLKYYPDALFNDYGRYDRYGWQKQYGGDMAILYGNDVKVGNVANMHCYPTTPGQKQFGTFTTPDGYNNAKYAATPFNMVLWKVNENKGIAEANDLLSVHITFYNYQPDYAGTYSNTPYYSELIYHLGMLDPQPFIGYVVGDEVIDFGKDNPDPDASDYEAVLDVVRELMGELTRVAGYSDRKTIQIPANWNNDFILSGMYANGRNIWRITPDTTGDMTLDAFKVEGADPTFYINGQTVTFPQGKILEDGQISKVGTCGYWIETPADVMPVITSGADRYAKDPSFLEDFEGYESGMRLDKTISTAWDLATGTAKIQDNGGNKVLALTGSTTITNVNAPKNITAGDSYAKQQVWQATVTVPEDGELILMRCASKDKGIRIADGKVYYDNDGEYAEIPDVSVSAGGTYIIQRKVDFRNADNYTSTYIVCDATGKVLGSVKNAAMSKVTLPVANIHFSSKKVTGTAYINDYKLYPAGVTTDLMVYDVETGMEVDGNVSRDTDTAYRLSWLNATGEDIMAQVCNNGTVVAEIKMAAGQDGVATAVIKADGNPILLTVKADIPADQNGSDGPSNDDSGTKPVKKNGLDGVMIAIMIVAMTAVVVIALLVVIIVLMRKKKMARDAEKTTETE
ncbi:MAG: hypothetical protein IKK11_00170 [Oscillospiraceae bacterium]|nr:hypothetical protein [Oscillospiraceae bacterium]